MNYRQNIPSNCQSCVRPMPEPRTSSNVCDTICACPIAMAYVPDQHFQTTYDLNRSLEVGTIFPELHKPFCGKRCMR